MGLFRAHWGWDLAGAAWFPLRGEGKSPAGRLWSLCGPIDNPARHEVDCHGNFRGGGRCWCEVAGVYICGPAITTWAVQFCKLRNVPGFTVLARESAAKLLEPCEW